MRYMYLSFSSTFILTNNVLSLIDMIEYSRSCSNRSE